MGVGSMRARKRMAKPRIAAAMRGVEGRRDGASQSAARYKANRAAKTAGCQASGFVSNQVAIGTAKAYSTADRMPRAASAVKLTACRMAARLCGQSHDSRPGRACPHAGLE